MHTKKLTIVYRNILQSIRELKCTELYKILVSDFRTFFAPYAFSVMLIDKISFVELVICYF